MDSNASTYNKGMAQNRMSGTKQCEHQYPSNRPRAACRMQIQMKCCTCSRWKMHKYIIEQSSMDAGMVYAPVPWA
eukprot:447617-Pleurochrysis_carterae.AAC.1